MRRHSLRVRENKHSNILVDKLDAYKVYHGITTKCLVEIVVVLVCYSRYLRENRLFKIAGRTARLTTAAFDGSDETVDSIANAFWG